jgi:hypothetical protein
LYGCYFDDERMIGFINDQIHSTETNDFVKLVSPFVDVAKLGHECPDFLSSFLYALGKGSRKMRSGCDFQIRRNFLTNE